MTNATKVLTKQTYDKICFSAWIFCHEKARSVGQGEGGKCAQQGGYNGYPHDQMLSAFTHIVILYTQTSRMTQDSPTGPGRPGAVGAEGGCYGGQEGVLSPNFQSKCPNYVFWALKYCFWPKRKPIFTQKFFRPKNFFLQTIFFLPQFFFNQNLFSTKTLFSTKNSFDHKFCIDQNFFTKNSL